MMQERQKGEAVKATALLQLMERLGPTKVSRALGVSTTTLYKARKSKTVSKSIELAAAAELRGPPQVTVQYQDVAAPERSATSGDRVIVIMEVPKGKVELLKRVALQFGAETVET